MRPRSLLVLLLVLAAGIAGLLWLDRPEEDKTSEEATLGDLLALHPGDAAAIDLEGGETGCRIERDGEGGWRLTSPVEAEADRRSVRNLLTTVGAVRVRQVVTEEPGDLSPFGLDEPEATLRVRVGGEARAAVLRVGRSSPVGSERYASVDDGRVLLVDGSILDTLDRDPSRFVEKRFLPIELEHIRRITLTVNGRRLTLQRKGMDWRMLEPAEDRADFTASDSLARILAGLTIDRPLDDRERARVRRVLAAPPVEIRVDGSDSAESYGMVIGPKMPGGLRYAGRFPLSGFYGTIPEGRVGEFERSADAYRERRLVFVSSPEVREIRVTRRAHAVELRRGAERDPWVVFDDAGRDHPADGPRVEEMLERVRQLRAGAFEEGDQDLPPPEVVLTLAGDGGDLGEIELWGPGGRPAVPPGNDERRWLVRSSWRPGHLFGVDAEAIGDLPEEAEDLVPGGTGEAASEEGGPSS